MIEVHSVIVVLVLEALVALLLALLFLAARNWFKRRRERGQVDDFVNRINHQADIVLPTANQPLSENSEAALSSDVLQETLDAVNHREKELYRHVLQAFLQRDAGKLAQLDQHVRALSEPYTRLIQEVLARPLKQPDTLLVEQVQQARAEANKAREEAEQIKLKLGNALNTLNNVSSEYAKMFHMPEGEAPTGGHQPTQTVDSVAPWLASAPHDPVEEKS